MVDARQLPLVFELDTGCGVAPSETRRREPRQSAVRLVEYVPFPRVDPRERPNVGFTRDVSDSGMCLGMLREPVQGSLLRVTVRELDGRRSLDALARVCWTERRGDRSCWAGLAFIGEARRGMVRVRSREKERRRASA